MSEQAYFKTVNYIIDTRSGEIVLENNDADWLRIAALSEGHELDEAIDELLGARWLAFLETEAGKRFLQSMPDTLWHRDRK